MATNRNDNNQIVKNEWFGFRPFVLLRSAICRPSINHFRAKSVIYSQFTRNS